MEKKGTKLTKKEIERIKKEDALIEKCVKYIFYTFFVITLILNIFVIFDADACSLGACNDSIIHNVVHSNLFFTLLWLENVLAIASSIMFMIFGIAGNNLKNILIGALGMLVPTIIWASIIGKFSFFFSL